MKIYVLPLRLGAHAAFLAAILTTQVFSDVFYLTAITVVFLIATNLLTRKLDIVFVLNLLMDRLTLLQTKIIVGPREARNPNLDSDQWIGYHVCAPRL